MGVESVLSLGSHYGEWRSGEGSVGVLIAS